MADPTQDNQLTLSADDTVDSEPQPSSPKAQCLIPHSRDDNFVDRPDLLENIHNLLSATTNTCQAALWGPGGCGKTHLAVEYAYRQNEDGVSVFWAHADTETSFYHDFSQIAKELGLDATLKGEALLTAVCGKLESIQGWFLVLDNVKDVELFQASTNTTGCSSLRKYIPKSSTGSVLWTSRSKSVIDTVLDREGCIEVGQLATAEALELLQVKMPEPIIQDEWNQAMKLFNELQWCPLAISLAGAYMHVTKCRLGEYLSKLAEASQQWDMTNADIDDTNQATVYGILKAWHVSSGKTLEENSASCNMMHVLSYLHNRNITLDLLSAIWKRVSRAENTSPKESKEENREKQDQEDQHEPNENPKEHEQHEKQEHQQNQEPLIQEKDISLDNKQGQAQHENHENHENHEQHEQQEQQEINEQQGQLEKQEPTTPGGDDLPDKKEVPEVQDQRGQLEQDESHGQHDQQEQQEPTIQEGDSLPSKQEEQDIKPSILRLAELSLLDSSDITNENYHMSEMLQDAIRYSIELDKERRGSTKFSKKALRAASDTFGQQKYVAHVLRIEVWAEKMGKETDTIKLLTRTSHCLKDCKLWGEKLRVDERVVQLHKRSCAEDRNVKLTYFLDSLAGSYEEKGQYDKAIELRTEILDQQRKLLGEKNLQTIHSLKYLAKSHVGQRDYARAEEIFKEMVKLQTEVIGTKDRSTMRGMSLLASTYRKQGRLDESRDMYVKVVELKQEFLGPTHPSTIMTMRDLAGAECRLGNYDESERLRAEVLQLQQKAYGEKNLNAVAARASLSNVYQRQKRYEEAAGIRAEVLRDRRELMGDTHQRTTEAMMSLASTYRELGRHDEALELCREVLATRQSLLGDENASTLDALMSYASTQRCRGELDEAYSIAKRVFQKERQLVGIDHPEVLNTMVALARILHSQGRHRSAIALMDECVERRRTVIGAKHRRTKECETMRDEWIAALQSGDGMRARL